MADNNGPRRSKREKLTASQMGQLLMKDESNFFKTAAHVGMMSISFVLALARNPSADSTVMDMIFDMLLFYVIVGVIVFGAQRMLIYYLASEKLSDENWDKWGRHFIFLKTILRLMAVATMTTGMASLGLLMRELMNNTPNRALFLSLQVIMAVAVSGLGVLTGFIEIKRPSMDDTADLPV